MRITSVEVLAVGVREDGPGGPLRAAIARLRTDDGLNGLGHALPYSARLFTALVAALEELGQQVVGQDPQRPEHVHARLLPPRSVGGGLGNVAAAVLDVAVWDLAAQAPGVPLYRLLGGHHDRIPAYASLRLPREGPVERLAEQAASLVAEGFRAMKMNVGGGAGIEADVARVRAVREAIGPRVGLLADANFRLSASQAIRLGRALAEFQLTWLEDPVPSYDLAGLIEVRRALETPVAACEGLFGLTAFPPLLTRGAVDVPMPDLLRVGGITPFVKVAHLAESFGLPIASHLLPEISAHVLAAVPNGHLVEHVDWATPLFDGFPRMEDGNLVLGDRPGHGLQLDERFARRHRLA